MFTLLNFGASPFRALFLLVLIVFGLTVLSNIVAATTSHLIDRRTKRLIERYGSHHG